MTIVVAILILIIIIIWFGGTYNSFVRLEHRSKEIFSEIDALFKKRCELIPGLIDATKVYLRDEMNILESLVVARMRSLQASPREKNRCEATISHLISRIFSAAEHYPELNEEPAFTRIKFELSSLEAEIEGVRKTYNGIVTRYNTLLYTVPSNMIARANGFEDIPLFEFKAPEDDVEITLK